MMKLHPLTVTKYMYTRVIGTGGIGSGMFFKLEGNHTLGRNESRSGDILPFKDYCKLHIISHYIAVLLGSKTDGSFQVIPIGKVGNDETGRRMYEEMKQSGMVMEYVRTIQDESTLFSVCFQYPDSTGGNITTASSASSKVLPEDIDNFFKDLGKQTEKELILAAPEVPVATRIKLLEYGRLRGSYNTASLLSGEVSEFGQLNGFKLIDLLAVNIDEACSIAGISDQSIETEIIIQKTLKVLYGVNPDMTVIITAGPKGSYCCQKNFI